ncbi:MAG: metallophosphoesterase [Acutalibacteraceae bacterium]
MKSLKKVLAVLMSIVMVFSMTSVMGFAEDNLGTQKSQIKFAVLSDPHYYPDALTGDDCQAWLDYCAEGTKLYRQSKAIIETAIETMLIRNPDLKYILVPGDLTKDSEYLAHRELAEIFLKFEEQYGLDFLVTPGNHDINSTNATTFENGKREQGRAITYQEFREVYKDLGYDLAIAEYAQTGDDIQGQLSYIADLGEDYRLIVLDSNKYSFGEPEKGKTDGTVTDELLKWACDAADEAVAQGKVPMVMVHHGMAAHMETEPSITFAFPLDNYMYVSETLADHGVHYAFTGHLHTDDTASVINDNGEVLYDIETASVTGYPNTYREITLTNYTSGESKIDIQSIDFDAEKAFTFDGVTYENGTYKNKAFALCFGGAVNKEGKPDCKDFLMGVVKTYLGGILEDIQQAGSIGEYLKTMNIDLEKIIGGFLAPYIGEQGIALGDIKIFSVDNIMWFIDDLLGQVYDLYVADEENLYALLDEIIGKLVNFQVSEKPCTKFIDTLGFGDPNKPGTLNDAVLTAMAYWYIGNEDTSDDEFILDVIDQMENGKIFHNFFYLIVDTLVYDLLEDALLSKLEIRVDKLFADDKVSVKVSQEINNLLKYVLKDDFTYMNLVNTIFAFQILPYNNLYDVLDKELMQKYLTDSQLESLGIFVAYILTDFTTDLNPAFKGDYDISYNSLSVEVPVSRENYRLPTMVNATLGDDRESAYITWHSKSTVGGDIEIYQSETEPFFTGIATDYTHFGVEVESEKVIRSYPGIDIGIFGLFTYEFEMNKHVAKLTDLTPGATYFYRVGDAERGWWSETGSFKVADGSDDITFIHITDPQSQNEKQYNRAWAKVLDSAFENYPDADFILSTGDQVDHGDNQKQWAWMFNTGSDKLMNTFFMPAAGNHEGKGTNALYNYFTLPNVPEQDETSGTYYSFDYNNAHFAVLNTNDLNSETEALSDKQIEWLTADMNASDAQWKFVALHKALYSQGSHYDDDDVIAMRAQLGKLMPELGIDLVFQGHDHVYMRTGSLANNALTAHDNVFLNYGGDVYKAQVAPTGTTYVISGTAGVKTYIQNDVTLTDEYFPRGEAILSVDYPMYSAVNVVDGVLYFEAYEVTEDGSEVVDRFAIQKDTTQGDVNHDYVEPEKPGTEETNGSFAAILDKIFKVLQIIVSILAWYIVE